MATINKVADRIARGFSFGYHTIEDIKQEARRMGLDALTRYDGQRPLENFIQTHVRNRLVNFKRDHFHRADPPCKICERFYPNPTPHDGGLFCPEFLSWLGRNRAKQSLCRPTSLDFNHLGKKFSDRSRVEEAVFSDELRRTIDIHLPRHLRADYRRMLDGVHISPARQKAVREEVSLIIRDHKGGRNTEDLKSTRPTSEARSS